MVYNDTFMNNVTNILDLLVGIGQNINQSSYIGGEGSNLLGILILVTVFIIFMALSYRLDWREVMIIDFFAVGICALLLFFAGVISLGIVITPFVCFCVCVIWFYFLG